MNRCPCNGSSGATVWKSWLSSVSGQLSDHCTDACRIFRCLPSGSSDASLLIKIQTRSNPVKVTPMYTPMIHSMNHRFFRCLRVCGPAHTVSLNSLVGPACQLHPPSSSQFGTTAAAPHTRAPLRRRPHVPPLPPKLCSAATHPPRAALHPALLTPALHTAAREPCRHASSTRRAPPSFS